MPAVDPRYVIQPGWYWWHYRQSTDAAALEEFRAANQQFIPRKRMGGETADASVLVFEVRDYPVLWTLPGRPSAAPKKDKTTLQDLTKGPPPEPSLVEAVEEITGQAWEAFKRTGRSMKQTVTEIFGEVGKAAAETASQANTAIKVLFWGAVVVLLVNLYRSTSPDDEGDHG